MELKRCLAAVVCSAAVLVGGCGNDSSGPEPPTTGALIGRAISIEDSTGIAGVQVHLVRGEDFSMRSGPATTDSSGSYFLEGVEAGEYYVTIVSRGRTVLDRSARRVSIVGGDTVECNLRMAPTVWHSDDRYVIRGAVLDNQTGRPVQGALVTEGWGSSWSYLTGNTHPFDGITDREGRFELREVFVLSDDQGRPLGLSSFFVTHPDYRPFTSPTFPLPISPDTIVTTEVRLLLKGDPDGVIRGMVLCDGSPVKGIRVALDYWDWYDDGSVIPPDKQMAPVLGATARTNGEGRYEFLGICPGNYTVLPAYLPDDGYVLPPLATRSFELEEGGEVDVPDIRLVRAIEPISPARREAVAADSIHFEWVSLAGVDSCTLWLAPVQGLFEDPVPLGAVTQWEPIGIEFPAHSCWRWYVDGFRRDTLVATFEEVATFTVR